MQVDNLKLIIIAGEAKTGPPLGPVLAPYYINLVQFCKEFNSMSLSYESGIEIGVKVQVDKNKAYKILLGYPQVTLIFYSFVEEDIYLNYFAVFFLKEFIRKKLFGEFTDVGLVRMLFGFFSTFNNSWQFKFNKKQFIYNIKARG